MHHKKILLYITGGIASYKVPALVRMLVKNDNDIKIIMTKSATKFVTPLTLETLCKNKVYVDFEDAFNEGDYIPHVSLAKWADFSMIVPATANIIGKLANGIADDLVTSTLIASNHPKYIVPAMNDQMWENPATQRNVKQLNLDGYKIMDPEVGFLAEGYNAKGRMPEIEDIYNWIQNDLLPKSLSGKSILVTAGGTQEPIDPVRFIGNYSSGKMGIQIAKAAKNLGAKVTLIIGATNQIIPTGMKVIKIKSFKDLQKTLYSEFPKNDVLIMAAAVSDYHVKNTANQKIKAKENDEVQITLERNPNLLRNLGKSTHNQLLIGFAAETNHLIENAQFELKNKNLDMLIANDVSRTDIGFGSDENEVYLITPNDPVEKIKKTTKKQIAQRIVQKVASLMKKEED
nr:bifunctional phosphopantothenoylcysteine decarboxylase/phosphopantothenate--cysteine ligase CoaBC [uncultured Ligilactobacillus sp.]